MSTNAEDEEDTLPSPPLIQTDYRDPPPRRKPISFIAASSSQPPTAPKGAIGQSYLSLVLPLAPVSNSSSSSDHTQPSTNVDGHNSGTMCNICNLPMSANDLKRHHTSTAHQVCLKHTHVPSSIDRSRKGLHYLQAYGFDPDARTGLGSAKSGMLHPIKQTEKIGKEGIGAVPKIVREKKEKVKKLGPKEIREIEKGKRKRNERLQRMLFSSGEVDKYLGPDA